MSGIRAQYDHDSDQREEEGEQGVRETGDCGDGTLQTASREISGGVV